MWNASLCDPRTSSTAAPPAAEAPGESTGTDRARKRLSHSPVQSRALLQPHAGHGSHYFPFAGRHAEHDGSRDSYRQSAPGDHSKQSRRAVLPCAGRSKRGRQARRRVKQSFVLCSALFHGGQCDRCLARPHAGRRNGRRRSAVRSGLRADVQQRRRPHRHGHGDARCDRSSPGG